MTSGTPATRPAILLDRDGTIIVEKDYLSDPDQVVLEASAIEGLRRLTAAGFALVVVSNQSGIGRGKFGVEAADAVNARAAELLAAGGVQIEGWYICPHAPDVACDCRKPAPGMALRAAVDLGLDLQRSFVIGDKRSDVELASAVGARGLLVRTGYGRNEVPWAQAAGVPICDNLEEAATVIVRLAATPSFGEPHDSALRVLAASAQAWIRERALPLWSTAGFDAETDSFHDLLRFDGQSDASVPRRVMVQCRQISVFARAAIEGDFPAGADLARRAGRSMVARYWRADGEPGWVFSVDRDGNVVDRTRDLYAHAFVLFALAWLKRLDGGDEFDPAIAGTLAVLDDRFADPLAGGFWDSLPRKDGLRRQNPHMHLFEALIELAEVDPNPDLLRRCFDLDRLAREHFFDPSRGTLREYFHDDWSVAPRPGEGSVEPGHQMEWAWLWRKFSELTGEDRGDVIAALIESALATGVDPKSGRIVDECREDGTVVKRSSRSWPHAEAAKALVRQIGAGKTQYLDIYERIYRRLLETYCADIHSGGWMDHLDERDEGLSKAMPASSLYHLYFGLRSVFELV